MTSSFAAFASQMLQRPASSSQQTEENPMFFSFTSTDAASAHDEDDPHLMMGEIEDEDEDEEDPFLASSAYKDDRGRGRPAGRGYTVHEEDSDDEEEGGGWLAHQGTMAGERHIPVEERHIAVDESLTASLLPSRSIALPDPFGETRAPPPVQMPRRAVTYTDPIPLCIYLGLLTLTCIYALYLLFHTPPHPSSYRRLLKAIPLLATLTFTAAGISYAQMWCMGRWAREVLLVSGWSVPVALGVSAIWAFVGSFGTDGGGWPVRALSAVLLLLAYWTSTRLRHLPREIHVTTALLALITRFLSAHSELLLFGPAVLLGALLASLPFWTILFRVSFELGNVRVWSIVAMWIWTWGVARAVVSVAVGATMAGTGNQGRWEAVEGSMGSVVLGSAILAAVRMLALAGVALTRVSLMSPILVRPARVVIAYLEHVQRQYERYAMVHVGLAGGSFLDAARASRGYSVVKSGTRVMRPPEMTLLLAAPLVLPLPAFLALFFTFGGNWEISIVGAGVVAATAWMCVGLVRDVADAFWVAVCLGDRDSTGDEESGRGGEARAWIDEIRDAFEYKPTAPPPAQRAPPQAESFPRRSPHPPSRSVYSPPPPPPPAAGRSSIYSPPPPSQEVERDINPFEDVRPPPRATPTGHSREERLADSSSSSSSDEDEEVYGRKSGAKEEAEEEEDDDGSTFFPGSGLFGSGVA
ncbi:hypothetical protein BDZ89DRAFT_1130356 [Hymenopellis radicata]|nr:hypothetical protein BDZ89DRAFT_1130356 [Hymenopellis radicata]